MHYLSATTNENYDLNNTCTESGMSGAIIMNGFICIPIYYEPICKSEDLEKLKNDYRFKMPDAGYPNKHQNIQMQTGYERINRRNDRLMHCNRTKQTESI